jgi:hypothetical protein
VKSFVLKFAARISRERKIQHPLAKKEFDTVLISKLLISNGFVFICQALPATSSAKRFIS